MKIKEKFYKMNSQNKAFSMIELSLVILLLSLVIVGIILLKGTESDNTATNATKKRMELLYKSLEDYVAKNKKLPCPASLTDIKSTSATYGTSVSSPSSGKCATGSGVYESGAGKEIYYGMVPVKTLGLSTEMAEDGFGSKIGYVVDGTFTTIGSAYFGNKDIPNDGTASGTNKILIDGATDAMFLLISQGKNKLGAFNANSSSQISPTGASTQEAGNIANSSNIFYSDAGDDIIFYKPRSQMLSDFKAGNEIYCRSSDSSLGLTYGTTATYTWPDAKAGQIIESNVNCPTACVSNLVWNVGVSKPTRMCLDNGQWGSVQTGCSSGPCPCPAENSDIIYGGIAMRWPKSAVGTITATTPCPSSCNSGTRWNAGAIYPTRSCTASGWGSVITACTSTSCSTNCSATSETLYGTTVSWPLTSGGSVATSTTACPTTCDNGSAWNGGPVYPTKQCNSDGTWGAVQSSCISRPCCVVNNGYSAGNAIYSGDNTTLYNNQTLNMTCNSGFGRRLKQDSPGTGTVGGTSCDRSQTQYNDRIDSDPYLTCSSGSLSVSNPCSICRDCSSGTSTVRTVNFTAQDECGNTDLFASSYYFFGEKMYSQPHIHNTRVSNDDCRGTYNRVSKANCGDTGNCHFCRFSHRSIHLRCVDNMYIPTESTDSNGNPYTGSTTCTGATSYSDPGGSTCRNRDGHVDALVTDYC